MSVEQLAIAALGLRGEGVAAHAGRSVYVPYALPGETVRADRDGETAHLIEILTPRPDRIAPICQYFGTCGGCAVQALPFEPYAEWKRQLVVDVLARARLSPPVDPLVDAHGAGRRRATIHVRVQPTPNLVAERKLRVGFMRARAHEVVDILGCPILSPDMAGAVEAARMIGKLLLHTGKPLDFVVTATAAGLDVDLRGIGPLAEPDLRALGEAAASLDLARLANHGEIVIERRAPVVKFGPASVVIPPGAFLQATAEGEAVLAKLVQDGVGTARKVADLFCGLGTFALRLAVKATVSAIDIEGPSLAALSRAARQTPVLRPVTAQARDLFRRPLTAA
ncbi:MAG: class I SAM-dependent RNA methyltransferase, partial [Actinomycetospora chiangmaiensis]|nr:class I SAM-dependent RNA methyltransferase [Actinomycetospora chiangmaiensis]